MEDQVRNAPRGRGFRRNIEQDWGYLRRLIITVVVVALAYFVWRISDILLLVFAAVLLATLLRSLADLISQHTPIPTRWSLTAATLMIASLVIGFLILFGSQISGQVAQVSDNLPVAVDALGRKIGVSGITAQIEQAIATGAGPSILSRAAGWGYTIIGALADLALVIVAGIYLAADPRLYRRGAAKLLPPSQHERVLDAMDVTGSAIRLWFSGQLVSMALVGVVSGLAYWWIGLPAPLALATIAAVTNFVPFVGPLLGAAPALLLAFTMDPATIFWTLGAVAAIQQIEGNVITPIIQRRAASMPPVLVLFAIVVFGLVFGLLGIFLAVPLAVAITVLVKKLWVQQTLGEETIIPGEEGNNTNA